MSDSRSRGWKAILSSAKAGARVLIVDDEPRVRKSLERLVGDFGYQTRAAASAEEGDSWLSAESFDVVLLDIELPKMSGLELLGWVLNRDPEQAVVMLTGLDDQSLAMECLDAGARNYLVKPADPDILERVVRDAVAVGRLLKAYNRLSVTGLHSR